MSRWGPSVDGSLTTLAVIAASVLALSVVSLAENPPTQVAVDGGYYNPNGSTGGNAPTTGGTNGQPAGTPGQPGQNKPGAGPASPGPIVIKPGEQVPVQGNNNQPCNAQNNGGSTDRGVTATQIKLGATVVQSGIGASFLGPVRTSLIAVKDQVNAAGGICGRKLDLKLVDDGWEAQRGYQFIQNLVESQKVFALAVNPSSEGLRIASSQKYLERTKTPVVGSDGMLNDQYSDPWVWPVAASTVSTMHIIAKDAVTRLKAQRFGIVFDSRYHFGVEGAFAFNAAVKRLTGQDIPGYFDPSQSGGCSDRFCAISAGQSSYDTENKAFNDACFGSSKQGGTCEFVALLLEPNEAVNFLRNGFEQKPEKGFGLAQTLFSRSFASSCGSICDGMLTWTGYNPPVDTLRGLPAVQQYTRTVTAQSANVDTLNQFLEGGYTGMRLLVDALKAVGPNLTRERLRATLDNMDWDIGLTTPLKWRKGNHFANVAMQSFAIVYKGGAFNGFRPVTGWVKDPYVGLDMG